MWPTADNTQQLLANAREGDEGAVNRLLEKHREAVRRMIDMRMDQMLKRRVDASDIVQEVMIDANRRLEKYLKDPAMPFHLWMRQIAKDRLIDAHRKHRGAARRNIDREQAVGANFSGESSLDLVAQLRDQELTPVAAATWHELQRRFKAACDQLDQQDQEVVLMRHFEQLSNAEAAIAMNISPQAASMRYLRAMRRLRESLNEIDPSQQSSS